MKNKVNLSPEEVKFKYIQDWKMIQNKYDREYYQKNRQKRNAQRRAYYRKHRKMEIEKALERDHVRRYGISREEKYKRLKKQRNRCAICRTKNPGSNDWHTDHDHETGEIRGILCGSCNLMLGKAQENARILIAAAVYLLRKNKRVE